MGHFELHQYSSPEELAEAAANDWLIEVSRGSSVSAPFCTALSGGRIAGVFFSAIAEQARARRISLSGVHFCWSDERCVAPSDPESNFRRAQQLLLEPLNIASGQIHRVPGELAPEQAAAAAETELRRLVSERVENQPVLDLVLLGMGEDGHVASLFPSESEEITASKAVFRCVKAVKPPPLRITLGYSALAVARQVWVMASGHGKEQALRESLGPGGDTPLARVLKMRSATRIYSDIRLTTA